MRLGGVPEKGDIQGPHDEVTTQGVKGSTGTAENMEFTMAIHMRIQARAARVP